MNKSKLEEWVLQKLERPIKQKPKPDGSQPRYASFNERLVASAIDTALSLLLLIPFMELFYPLIYGDGLSLSSIGVMLEERMNAHPVPMLTAEDVVWVANMVMESGLWNRWMMDNLLQLLFLAVLIIPFWHYRSATPGKMLLGLRVINEKTGEKPGTGACIMRFFGYLLSSAPLFLGFFAMLWDKKKRCWHDRMAGTVVMKYPRKFLRFAGQSDSPEPASAESAGDPPAGSPAS